jgi:ADP-ribosyl-[dinitrogen reductase] hydrolase
MATRFVGQSNDKQQNMKLLELVKLLDKDQPYNQFKQSYSLESEIPDDPKIKKIKGSLVGLAIGDALGASVEFRPYAYLKAHEVKDMQGGGTWGLQAGQWTDDTSMALCLAASLIVKGKSDSYDQFERYRRWYRNGYMSSTGKCFDIGKSTREAITMFESCQKSIRRQSTAHNKKLDDTPSDSMIEEQIRKDKIDLKYGTLDSAGNGPLMRLGPIPCFFKSYNDVINCIDEATQLTHGDQRAIDACRFYAGLIWHAIDGKSKEEILDKNFYSDHLKITLHDDIKVIAEGSYKEKKRGYEDGIRGKGYIVNALEAALWAFYHDEDDFKKGVLMAVNLGDDTDTTAAIYGELAGAMYGFDNIPPSWIDRLYQGKFIMTLAEGLYMMGHDLKNKQKPSDRVDEKYQTNNQARANDTNRNESAGTDTTSPGEHAGMNGTPSLAIHILST